MRRLLHCSLFSGLDYRKAINIVPVQVGELGILNWCDSHENITDLMLLNVVIHHYFKTIGWVHSSAVLPQKFLSHVTLYSLSLKAFVAKMKHKSLEVRHSLGISLLR